MLNQIYRAFYQKATGVNLLFLALTFLLFIAWVKPWAEAELKMFSTGIGSLDLHYFYGPDEAYTKLKGFGVQGRLFYTMVELSADLVYPLVYALLLSGLIVFIYNRIPLRRATIRRLFLVPLLAMLADYAENTCIISMLIHYPYRQDGLAMVGAAFTGLKWLLFFASLLIVVYGTLALARAYVHVRYRAKNNQLKVPPGV
jgi:hypothetical protein